MTNANIDSLFARRLSAFLPLSRDEQRGLAELYGRPVKVKRDKQLVEEGQTGHRAFVLQEGWACSYKILSNGSRQIISFPIPGDCVWLRSLLLRTADHSFSTLTDASSARSMAHAYWRSSTSFRALARRFCGQRPVTRPWSWSTSSALDGGAQSSAQLTFSWNWRNG